MEGMKFRIVADSSSNVFTVDNVDYKSVPLKIISGGKEYEDVPGLDVDSMVEELRSSKDASSTSCPNVHDWLEAFEGADCIFAVTITSALSGSYNAALQAKDIYLEEHENANICVIDSKTAGEAIGLIIEKLKEMILQGKEFNEIESAIRLYQKRTYTLFALKSLGNLAKNGRINPAIAKVAEVLGICVIGTASEHGTIEALHKCRSEKRVFDKILSEMRKNGFKGGKVRISNCMNAEGAESLREHILRDFPTSSILITKCTALCSYYAEKGGMIIGYEA